MIPSRRNRQVRAAGILRILRAVNSRMLQRLRSQFNKSRMMRGKRKTLLLCPQERLARKQPLRRALPHHAR